MASKKKSLKDEKSLCIYKKKVLICNCSFAPTSLHIGMAKVDGTVSTVLIQVRESEQLSIESITVRQFLKKIQFSLL